MYYVDLSMHISIVWIKERNKKQKNLIHRHYQLQQWMTLLFLLSSLHP